MTSPRDQAPAKDLRWLHNDGGCYRVATAIRRYLATVMNNGENPLKALRRLMVADPWMPPLADSGTTPVCTEH